MPTTNPTRFDPLANPGLKDEKPATNRLSRNENMDIYSGILKMEVIRSSEMLVIIY
jgi:hypothetical protein